MAAVPLPCIDKCFSYWPNLELEEQAHTGRWLGECVFTLLQGSRRADSLHNSAACRESSVLRHHRISSRPSNTGCSTLRLSHTQLWAFLRVASTCLVDVKVDDQDSLQGMLRGRRCCRHRDVVEDAEALATILHWHLHSSANLH